MSLAKTAIYTLLVPVALTVLIPWALVHGDGNVPTWGGGPWRWLGLAPMALGAALYLWCAWEFATAGRGTPNPADPPRALVARGPYRVVRNPMYVAVNAVIIGEALLFRSAWLTKYALGSLVFVQCLVVLWEEPGLRRRYGDGYMAYCAAVPRWFPRLRRR